MLGSCLLTYGRAAALKDKIAAGVDLRAMLDLRAVMDLLDVLDLRAGQ